MNDTEKAQIIMQGIFRFPEIERLKIYGDMLDKYAKQGLKELSETEIISYWETRRNA